MYCSSLVTVRLPRGQPLLSYLLRLIPENRQHSQWIDDGESKNKPLKLTEMASASLTYRMTKSFDYLSDYLFNIIYIK